LEIAKYFRPRESFNERVAAASIKKISYTIGTESTLLKSQFLIKKIIGELLLQA
jgi:hypothetical protein